jgi:hypothetical protein
LRTDTNLRLRTVKGSRTLLFLLPLPREQYFTFTVGKRSTGYQYQLRPPSYYYCTNS